MGSMEDDAALPFMCGVEEPARLQYDWGSGVPLGTYIVQQMADRARVSATDVPESLYGRIDPDALEDLFRPLVDGTPRANGEVTFTFAGHYVTVSSDGTIEIESELGRLKRSGGNVLLTGDVPADVFDELSAQFLGEQEYGRTHLFALYGRDTGTARTRLERATADTDHANILTYEAAVRSATEVRPQNQQNRPSVTPVVGSLDEFETAIVDDIFEHQYRQKGFEPGQLRFCFDSLQFLSEEESESSVEEFVRNVTKTVEDVSGLGQYLFPGAYDSAPVRAVEPLFDGTIELKVGARGPMQRWHLHDTDYTTTWFPL
ncbi:HalOD1 output domain-containing protein (plasmid) [Haladaptatus sp. SPP-AMP-3]|uniref:DUF7504 family protein n=1 Tax=Haladaptatus sp. SPP-AMP-3 TaxID=3121295 RepID=UPI003C2AEDD6